MNPFTLATITMPAYPLAILILLCLFCLALGGVITFIGCAAWYLKHIAEGEPDVNGAPELDAGSLPLDPKEHARASIATGIVILFALVSLMAALGFVLFES